MGFSRPPLLQALIAGALLLSGCATTYPVRFNGYTQPDSAIRPAAVFYVRQNANTGNPLLDREIAGKIGLLLTAKGYGMGESEQAEYILTYGYSSTGQSPSDIKPAYSTRVDIGTGIASGAAIGTSVIFPGGGSAGLSYRDEMTVQVYDSQQFRLNRDQRPLWIGESALETREADLREAVNYLLVPIFDHFGENTRRAVRVEIKPGDPVIRTLKGENHG